MSDEMQYLGTGLRQKQLTKMETLVNDHSDVVGDCICVLKQVQQNAGKAWRSLRQA